MSTAVRDFSPIQLLNKYRVGMTRPTEVVSEVLRRIGDYQNKNPDVWTAILPESEIYAIARELENHSDPGALPLYGLPFSIKDNIDLHGFPTTCSHPVYKRSPERSATVVEEALRAGAIPIGKNSLDQFATGLSGMRSAKTPCFNAIRRDLVPGGSSSGSAIAVAAGLVSFGFGTDTGGSGRIPAAMNNVVGIKPTHGALSDQGLVHNSRFLDTVSILSADAVGGGYVYETLLSRASGARNVAMARPEEESWQHLWQVGRGFEFFIPDSAHLEFFGDEAAKVAYGDALQILRTMGGRSEEIDFQIFRDASVLPLRSGLVAERDFNFGGIVDKEQESTHPAILHTLESAKGFGIRDYLSALYSMLDLRQMIWKILQRQKFLVVPTVPKAFTRSELMEEPITRNYSLGYYSYFANSLDLPAVAVPVSLRPDGAPAGITIVGLPGQDLLLIDMARRFGYYAGIAPGVDALEVERYL